MSLVAPIQRRPWLALGTALALVLVLITALVVLTQPGRRLLSRGTTTTEESEVAEPLNQARWRMSGHPAGMTSKLTKAQTLAVREQRPRLEQTIRQIYDALFVEPANLNEVVRKTFTPAAATAMRRSKAGVSAAGLVSTTYRRARIGIQPTGGARRAVASVVVRGAQIESERRLVHRSTLWFERKEGDWTVVAFDVSQTPLADKDTGDRNGGQRDKRGDKKKKKRS